MRKVLAHLTYSSITGISPLWECGSKRSALHAGHEAPRDVQTTLAITRLTVVASAGEKNCDIRYWPAPEGGKNDQYFNKFIPSNWVKHNVCLFRQKL